MLIFQIYILIQLIKKSESEKVFNINVNLSDKFKFIFIQLYTVTIKSHYNISNMKFKGDEKKVKEMSANEIR